VTAHNYAELFHRQQKVIAITDCIDRAAIKLGLCPYTNASELADFWELLATPNNWVAIETLAGVRESSKQTRLDVIARLRARIPIDLDAHVATRVHCKVCGGTITGLEECPDCADAYFAHIGHVDPHAEAE
jgi:hypothetical protein